MKKQDPWLSHKERENCICHNVQNLSYWNRYFVIYPHKCTFNNLKKKYQEKWENAYVTVKNTRASRVLRWALDPGQYWLALLTWLYFAMSAKSRKKFLGPPLDQILDPLVENITWSVISSVQTCIVNFRSTVMILKKWLKYFEGWTVLTI